MDLCELRVKKYPSMHFDEPVAILCRTAKRTTMGACQFPYREPCNALISALRREDGGAKRDMSEDTRGHLSWKSQDQHTALLEICYDWMLQLI